jgi:hypothetical protein
MKVEIDITEQEIKDLKVIRTYFGANDKTMLEHMAYKLLDDLVKKLTIPVVVDCKHDNEIMRQGDGFAYSTCGDCGDEL